MRIILFAGKGGVGKTSVAAATGIKTAQMGHKTVVMSLDVAHSLADIFDFDGICWTRIRDNLSKSILNYGFRSWISRKRSKDTGEISTLTFPACSIPPDWTKCSARNWPFCPAWKKSAFCFTSTNTSGMGSLMSFCLIVRPRENHFASSVFPRPWSGI